MALTMIKVQPGHERSAYDDLRARPGIRDVFRLFGEYSFFLVMQAPAMMDLDQILLEVKKEHKVVDMGPFLLTAETDMVSLAPFQAAEPGSGQKYLAA